MTDRAFEVEVEGGISVSLPSGANFWVLTDSEKEYVEERVKLYMTHNHFVNVSDLQDIDRMVTSELLVYRWALWMSKQVDYYNQPIDEKQLAQQVNAYSTELRQLKRSLGIDKVSRDRQRGDDSVVAYLDNLGTRAKEFGVMRDRQSSKSIELFQQLKSLLTFYDNADEIERRENGVTAEEIFDWIRNIAIREFDSIDDEFRKSQKMWIRRM